MTILYPILLIIGYCNIVLNNFKLKIFPISKLII
uniref:Uncharacterized protein n=1 Tax=viral metagenome TaxID=1070528 RepID=A0A6C0LUL1_9ZZZZ